MSKTPNKERFNVSTLRCADLFFSGRARGRNHEYQSMAQTLSRLPEFSRSCLLEEPPRDTLAKCATGFQFATAILQLLDKEHLQSVAEIVGDKYIKAILLQTQQHKGTVLLADPAILIEKMQKSLERYRDLWPLIFPSEILSLMKNDVSSASPVEEQAIQKSFALLASASTQD